MRPIAVLFMVVTANLAASVIDPDTEEWEKYKIKFGKVYASPEEDLEHKMHYNKRKLSIEAHNERYNQGLESYVQGINQFTDLTPEEREMRRGFKALKANEPIDPEKMYQPTGNPTPPSIDWREKNVVTPVKDQGPCGSCWAFSTTGVLEGQYALKYGKLLSFSEKQLVDCDSEDYGCHGGLPVDAYRYIEKEGIESESDYPYDPLQGKCQYKKSDVKATISSFKQIKQGDENALLEATAHIGPISVAINDEYVQLYSSGIIDTPYCNSDPSKLNHAVLVVGYGVAKTNGTPYWLVKNSWGESWGEQGYFRIARGKNMCGIANAATVPVADHL